MFTTIFSSVFAIYTSRLQGCLISIHTITKLSLYYKYGYQAKFAVSLIAQEL
jgi:hypothetical protein